jgi:hypothetical protein
VLADYAAANQKTAQCMQQKGFSYNPGLAKSDVADAFGLSGKTGSGYTIPADVESLLAQAADDPNAAIVSSLTPSDQQVWAGAVNDCSAQVDLAAAGGSGGLAKVEALMRAAKASPEMKKAAQDYSSCMQAKGFSVAPDPDSAPQEVMDAEDTDTAAAQQLVDAFNADWHACVAPYQQALNLRLFG